MKKNDKIIPADLDLIKNFKEGDLLYGIDTIRIIYLKLIEQQYGKGGLYTIDRFNKMIGLDFLELSTDDTKEDCKKALIDTSLEQKNIDKKQQKQIEDYVDDLVNSEKYSPLNKHKIASDSQKQKQNRALEEQRIIYACKAVLDNEKFRIHFCLDTIDMEKVLTLTGHRKQDSKGYYSYTSAELRHVFKNWERLENRVMFYNEGMKIAPPWIEDNELWISYQKEKEAQNNKKVGPILICHENKKQNNYSNQELLNTFSVVTNWKGNTEEPKTPERKNKNKEPRDESNTPHTPPRKKTKLSFN